MTRFLIHLGTTAVAIWAAVTWLSGLSVTDSGRGAVGQALVFLGIAVIFTIVNSLVKPVLSLISLPLMILTLGLFYLVINALMLMLTAWLTQRLGWGLTVHGFWSAVVGAVVIGVVNWVLGILIPDRMFQRR